MTGTYPNCEVIQASGGQISFNAQGTITSDVIGLTQNYASVTGIPNILWYATPSSQSGEFSDYNIAGTLFYTDGGAQQVIVPPDSDLTFRTGTQAKVFPTYKQYGSTTGAGSVSLVVHVLSNQIPISNITCLFLARAIGRVTTLKTSGFTGYPIQAGYVANSFDEELLITVENQSQFPAVGTQPGIPVGTPGYVILNTANDSNQSTTTVSVTYGVGGESGFTMTVTTDSSQGTVLWTLSAEGVCN